MVKLGSMVTDSITGFAGLVMARTEYLYGCVSVLVQPTNVTTEGKPQEAAWIDEQRLTVRSKAKAGGPQLTPPPRPTPSR